MTSVQKMLLDLKKKYHLSTSDLAMLLECNRSTVLNWERGVLPLSTREKIIFEKLRKIAAAKDKLSVPLSVTQYQRKQYLTDAVHGNALRISQSRSSRGRV